MIALETIKLSGDEIDTLYLRVKALHDQCHSSRFDRAYLSSTLACRRSMSANPNASTKLLKRMENDPDSRVLLNIKKQMGLRKDLGELNQQLLSYPDDNELLAKLRIELDEILTDVVSLFLNETDADEPTLLIGERLIVKIGESKVICQQGIPFYRKRVYMLLEVLTCAGMQVKLNCCCTPQDLINSILTHLETPAKEVTHESP